MLLRRAHSFLLVLLALGLALLGTSGSATAAPVLLVLGDSVSAGYGLAANTGWVTLLSQRLKAEGYSTGQITGRTLYRQLVALIKATQKEKPCAQGTVL